MKSGSLAVFATPALLALMEEAACASIKDVLQEEETTVGTAVNISHVVSIKSKPFLQQNWSPMLTKPFNTVESNSHRVHSDSNSRGFCRNRQGDNFQRICSRQLRIKDWGRNTQKICGQDRKIHGEGQYET
mmetsp:Transcript_1180/g.1947  ORF Transcript_1180/g.1947 Transcript_1180/m.1947 type:complete len:131 (+) Transcript_1180:356-748(+)